MNRQTRGISKTIRNKTIPPSIENLNKCYSTIPISLNNNSSSFKNMTKIAKPEHSPPTPLDPRCCLFNWKQTSTGIYEEETGNKLRKGKAISKAEILRVLHLPQSHAAKQLNCSLSTLKRRFYELKKILGLECWPRSFEEVRHLPIFKQMYPMSLYFILNSDNDDSE